MQQLSVEDIKQIIFHIKNIICERQDFLSELDSIMGDGDLGITMSRGFIAAHEEADQSAETKPGKLFIRIGMMIAKTAPSTMGTLIGTGFMKGGKAIEGRELIGISELAIFLETFVHSMMERGKSKPGNKTIIDSLFPAARALSYSAANEKSLVDGMLAAKAAAGLLASTGMKAEYGRAAYYQDASIGKQDGGATVGTYIVEGFYKHISKE